ncbi:MAG: hypothetical protein ACI39E_05210 [Acutalibacteraceae bacterium]
MRSVRTTLVVLLAAIVVTLVGCERPAYYDPYGGADPETITTATFRTATQPSMTGIVLNKPTTTTVLTVTTELHVPDGYMICPTCHGAKTVCEYCHGTGKREGETLDPNTGIYKKYTADCGMCSEEDPGYLLCETCHNKLVVPIS